MLKIGIIVGSTRPGRKAAAVATWVHDAAGFVGYGGAGGVRAVENLRLVMGEIKIADVRAQVALSMFTDFENFTTFKPRDQHDKAVHSMADEVIAWGGALKALRGTP